MEILFSILRKIVCWTFTALLIGELTRLRPQTDGQQAMSTHLRRCWRLPWGRQGADLCIGRILVDIVDYRDFEGVQVTWGPLSSHRGAWTTDFWARMLCCHGWMGEAECLFQTSPSNGNQNPPHPMKEEPRVKAMWPAPALHCADKIAEGDLRPLLSPLVSWSPSEDGKEGEMGIWL